MKDLILNLISSAMKKDTIVIILKAMCFLTIGGLTPLVSSLSQWAESGTWPKPINWIIIVAGCVLGAATQLLSFLSSSFAEYRASRNGTWSGNGGSVSGLPASTQQH